MKCFFFSIAFMIVLQVAGQKADTLLSGPYYFKNLEQERSENHITRQVLKGKTLALRDFEVKVYTISSGKALRTGHQGADLLAIIKEGELVAKINGKDRRLGPGSIAFIMSGDAYAFTNATSKPVTYYLLEYSGRGTSKADSSFALDWNNLKTNNTGKGYRRDFFNRATSQVKQFEMHTTALNAGEVSHAPHTHIQEEVILVLRGHVEMQIGDNFHEGDTGDLFFLSSNTPHALKNIGKEQCEYFAFQWRNQ